MAIPYSVEELIEENARNIGSSWRDIDELTRRVDRLEAQSHTININVVFFTRSSVILVYITVGI